MITERYLTGHFRQKGATPINPPHIIEFLQALEFQGFIFAFVAGIEDMQTRIDDNPARPHTDDSKAFHIVRNLQNALFDCGYSNKGKPYWVPPTGIATHLLENLHEAAMDGAEILNECRIDLKRAPPEKRVLFEARYAAYVNACDFVQKYADGVMIANWRAEALRRPIGPNDMCSLA